MSVFRIYSDKSNTISSRYPLFNSSRNPVTDLIYGGNGTKNNIQRHLVKFDLTDLQSRLSTFEINSAYTLTYKLRFKNAVPDKTVLEPEFEFDVLNKQIASSFDLVFFPLNKEFDEGRGYDLQQQKFLVKQNGELNISGYSNWYSASTTVSFDSPGVFINPTASTTPLFAIQHFETGGEDINVDVTSIVNNWLSGGSTNNGFGIAFGRPFELISGNTQYIASFFTNKTNTAFKPHLEVSNNQVIKDDRNNVTNNRLSKLFLYLFSGNTPTNYFSAGTVDIKNQSNSIVFSGLTPMHHSQGVYFVTVNMSGTSRGNKFKDIWNNVTFAPGFDQTTITQNFEIKNNYYLSNAQDINEYSITTTGIDNNSLIPSGDRLRVFIDTRVNYSLKKPHIQYGLEYRVVMNVSDTIIDWTPVNDIILSDCLQSYIDIDTTWLLTQQSYEIAFRVVEFGTKRMLPERISFRIVDGFDVIKLS